MRTKAQLYRTQKPAWYENFLSQRVPVPSSTPKEDKRSKSKTPVQAQKPKVVKNKGPKAAQLSIDFIFKTLAIRQANTPASPRDTADPVTSTAVTATISCAKGESTVHGPEIAAGNPSLPTLDQSRERQMSDITGRSPRGSTDETNGQAMDSKQGDDGSSCRWPVRPVPDGELTIRSGTGMNSTAKESKRRGRPPGSKNKRKHSAVDAAVIATQSGKRARASHVN
ncbi:hypothetical protein F4777DRAFT_123194 [Nemania sp. FL0916]|nr:hypothetical protein F4777DRAFT_123194 [Nemania sp. FL0916]